MIHVKNKICFTFIRPSTLILLRSPCRCSVCLCCIEMYPWGEGRCFTAGMSKLDSNDCSLCMCKFHNALKWGNLSICPKTLGWYRSVLSEWYGDATTTHCILGRDTTLWYDGCSLDADCTNSTSCISLWRAQQYSGAGIHSVLHRDGRGASPWHVRYLSCTGTSVTTIP